MSNWTEPDSDRLATVRHLVYLCYHDDRAIMYKDLAEYLVTYYLHHGHITGVDTGQDMALLAAAIRDAKKRHEQERALLEAEE